MYLGKKVSVALLMAGNGLRAEASTPKQFLRINGKRLYEHTIAALQKCSFIDEIVLICHQQWIVSTQKQYPNFAILPGGKTRQESSKIAVESIKTDIIMIHDAARPLVKKRILEESVIKAYQQGAVNTCIPCFDTVVIKDSYEKILDIPDRSSYFLGQTPQTFLRETLLHAHRKAVLDGIKNATDDCSLVLNAKHPVATVLGDPINIKATTASDIAILSHFLSKKKTQPQPTNSLEKKVYIVIGASGGIGQHIARLLSAEKAIAICVSRSSKNYPLDLQNPESIKKTFAKIYEEVGQVDGLINTAGYLTINPLKSLPAQKIEQLININLKGVIYACKCARIKKGGHILNFASSSFTKGRGGYGIYSACKAAIVNFTEALAEEEPDLCINSIVPPRCSTKMRARNFPNEDPTTLLSPEKVAESTICVLKDPDITGSIVELNCP